MTTREFQVAGMSCNHCVMAVNKSLKKFENINMNVEIGKVIVTFNESNINENDLVAAIEEDGYKVVNK